MKHKLAITLALAAVLMFALMAGVAFAGTAVPGHQGRYDQDNNGYPDAGRYVNGHYTSLYVQDASEAYYWDLGDGRIYTSPGVTSIDDLEQATLTFWEYEVNYRADFNNDPYMDHGWIINNIVQRGYLGNGHVTYLIVSDTDPRYTGNPDWAEWGTWEYHVLNESGIGNWVRISPMSHGGL